LAFQKTLEDLLAAALGAHDRVFHREKRFERQALRAKRMTGAQQTGEVMREQSLLEKALPREIGKIANRQIDVALFQAFGDLMRRHRYGPNPRPRGLGAQSLEQLRQEHHLADVR